MKGHLSSQFLSPLIKIKKYYTILLRIRFQDPVLFEL